MSEWTNYNFGLIVGRKSQRKYLFSFNPNYAVQKSGAGYVELGAEVLCLTCGTGEIPLYVWDSAHCLTLRCLDELLGQHKRIGWLAET
jgi:hypothetical protein